MSTQIQIRRDSTANWSSVDPILAEGEIGYDLTEEQFKVGDGATAWTGLSYSGGEDDGDAFSGDYNDLTNKPTLYTGEDAVKITGDQTIDGVKTFSANVTAPDFVATSDERAKENISPTPVGLIDDIKPVQWTWKESGDKSAGVIAQQLQEIGLGDFVRENENGVLGVNYNALISILIAEVISLKKERQ